MHALSVRQPWASLLVAGIKRIEVRTWATTHRGWLVVHAARGAVAELPDRLVTAFDSARDWPRGALLGLVYVDACVPIAEVDDRGDPLGLYAGATGYGWVVSSARPFTRAWPCRGRQGVWSVPARLLQQLRAAREIQSERS